MRALIILLLVCYAQSLIDYNPSKRPIHGVCMNVIIKNINAFKNHTNCTVIEGNLQVILIEYVEDPTIYDNISFPFLREVTGSLIFYRVYGLRTLSVLFPKLSVIRGQILFSNYALVIFDLPDLEEIGLYSLQRIIRGGIRIERNPQLCYISTIDWDKILMRHDEEEVYIDHNKDRIDCIDVCPKSSNGTELCPVKIEIIGSTRHRRPLCWSALNCQKVCPSSCGNNSCSTLINSNECCHKSCVGGCTGLTHHDCNSCLQFKYEDNCLETCPSYLYKFNNIRCVNESECRQIMLSYNRSYILWNGECTMECPSGYTILSSQAHTCSKCQGHCPKECLAVLINDVATLETYKGCTKINGALIIHIRGGNRVASELENNLGKIEEITHYLKIIKSYAIVSLRFLKNLRVIHGEKLFSNKYAFVALDNQNLQDIWDFETHQNLTIENGSIFFQFNRKLCLNKIQQFVESTGKNFSKYEEGDISRYSNGDQVPCQYSPIKLELLAEGSTFVGFQWKQEIAISDKRTILSWVINYRIAGNENITIFDSKDACSTEVWKVLDFDAKEEKQNSTDPYFIFDLKPNTKYVAYLQTYSIASSRVGAMSQLLFFTTLPGIPDHPRDVKVFAKYPGELHLKWKPPLNPNGNVTHYYLTWKALPLKDYKFDGRDYCVDKLQIHEKEKSNIGHIEINETQIPSSGDGTCCKCGPNGERKRVDEMERWQQINFENQLQNTFYIKQDSTKERQKRDLDVINNLTIIPHDIVTQTPSTYLQMYSSQFNTLTTKKLSSLGGIVSPSEHITTPVVISKTKDSQQEGIDEMMGGEKIAAVVYEYNEFIITNLKHFQEYSIEIVACHEYITGDQIKHCSGKVNLIGRTLEDLTADQLNANNVSHIIKSRQEVLILWSDPLSPNGVIILYEVEISRVGHKNIKPDVYCIPYKSYRENRGYKATMLSAGNWSYRIRATSLAGNGSWTPKFYFYLQDDNLNNGYTPLVVGMVVGFILIILLIILVLLYITKKRQWEKDDLRISINPNYTNPEDVYTPDEWEVDRDKITCYKELGSGSFGKVYQGVARNLSEGHPIIDVAIKTIDKAASKKTVISFLNEASNMKVFKNECNHVVKLFGVVSRGRPPLVIMELMSNGDLRDFLRRHRPDVVASTGEQVPSTTQIIRIASEIADGMAFIHSKNLIHRDLACRNCLVSENLVVKIADFGMTRDIYLTDYYRKNNACLLPVRWMPKESILDGYFDQQTDIWSFGVVLWEISTLGQQPYIGMSNEEVCQCVTTGGALTPPEGCHQILVEMMHICWQREPENRGSFRSIIEFLSNHVAGDFKEVSYYHTVLIVAPSQLVSDHSTTTTDMNDYIEDEAINSQTPLNNSETLLRLKNPTVNYRGFPLPILSFGRSKKRISTYKLPDFATLPNYSSKSNTSNKSNVSDETRHNHLGCAEVALHPLQNGGVNMYLT